jgi:hypothetical protein
MTMQAGEPRRAVWPESMAPGGFDRVLGSLHTIEIGDDPWPVDHRYQTGNPTTAGVRTGVAPPAGAPERALDRPFPASPMCR